jgi:TusA-related sulfurtransferase
MSAEMILCPHCGKENLPVATRCVHCGEDLEDLFRIEGTDPDAGLPEEQDISVSDLLQAFRQEDDSQAEKPRPVISIGKTPEPAASEETQSVTPEGEDEQTPEWLARIRKRALQEEDAAGELSRKINAMEASRAEEHQGRVDEEFANWIARIRENARRENLLAAKPAEPSPESEEGVPEWLRKVRELQPQDAEQDQPSEETIAGFSIEASAQEAEQGDEPALEQSEPAEALAANPQEESEPGAVPELESESAELVLHPDEEASPDARADEEPSEGPKTPELEPVLEELGLTAEVGALDLEEKPSSSEELSADLLLLRKQKENAQMLMTLIGEEGKGLPPAKTAREASKGWYRFILGAFLLLVLAAVIVFVPEARPIKFENPTPAVALKDALNALESGDTVLVVQEYQAATSAEMEQMSAPVLRALEERGVKLQFLTTHPNGLWLSANLMDAADIPAREISYLAGGRLGVLAAALQLDESSAAVPGALENLENYTLILLLEDSQADIQNWIEQAGPWLKAGKLGILASSQNAALLLPYYDAGQLAGYAAGTMEGRVLADALDAPTAGAPSRAYQAGLLVMIAVLLLGMIIKAEADSNARYQKEPEA